MRLSARLLAGTVGILAFAVLILAWASRVSLREDLEHQLRDALIREAELIQDALPRDAATWPRLVGHWASERDHQVTLFDETGRPLADNRLTPGQLETLAGLVDTPEMRAALAGRTGFDRRAEGSGPAQLLVAIPGRPIVRIAGDLSGLERTIAGSRRSVLVAALLAILLGALLAALAGRAIAAPIEQLATAARSIAAGQTPRFPRTHVLELDHLVQALRDMHQELATRMDLLKRERAESATLVDAMVEGVLASDSRGRIVTANPAARRLLGYGEGDPLPGLNELFRAKAAREVVAAALGGASVEDREIELDERILLVNARPLPSGGAVLVLHDMSELRRLQAVRRDFVANVSHELKTPLTSIVGYTETLLTEDPEEATRRQFLRTVLSNARRMQRLVDDQLELSRVESGRWTPAPEWVPFARAAEESWAPRADRAEREGLRFRIAADPGAERLWIDPEALRQILDNLFDNAIRHTSAGGVIACTSRFEQGGFVLAVQDTGTGIGSEHLPRIFERYYRADAGRSRDQGGTGLGLAIVKHLAEAHGGRVWAESELGRGTTIAVWTPQPR